jgi:cytidylate kinase
MGVPVVTVDGPSGSGKGSLCQLLAKHLGWHLLDSGALYRIVGLAAQKRGVALDAVDALAELAANLDVAFLPGEAGEPARVMLDGDDISLQVRAESSGYLASQVAVHQPVRDALMTLQRSFAAAPGLIADGRDMGTVVFPDAPLKVYLTASAQERAERRYKQLKGKGQSVTLAALLEDIKARDERDMNRAVAPLKPAADALQIDSTTMAIDDVFQLVLEKIESSF